MKILVVDDQQEILDMLHEFLTINNHTVYKAKDGKQAINLLAVYTVDCIITDIHMPAPDGIEFILRMRQSRIPIVSISGSTRESIVEKLLHDLGIVEIFEKPLDIYRLLHVLTALPERKGHIR